MAIKRGEELFANYRWAQNESDNNAFNVSHHQDKGWVLHFKGKAAGENNLAAFINSCINPDTGRESLVSGNQSSKTLKSKSQHLHNWNTCLKNLQQNQKSALPLAFLQLRNL